MGLQENIVKFDKIIKANQSKLPDLLITNTARAIVITDISHIGDDRRGKYEHLSLSALADSGVAWFKGVCAGCSHKHETISDVMVMRIMCDVLTILLDGDQPLAMQYSADVAKAMRKRERTRSGSYLEFDECEKILDSYAADAGYDASLKTVFERTASYLAELKKLQPKLDRDCYAIHKDCVKSVWLPKDFNSSGFEVSTKIPKSLDGVPGDVVTLVTSYNFGYVLDVLIKAIVREGKGEIAQWGFLNRLQDISAMSPSNFPIATGVVPGIREDVYVPYHFLDNQALRVVYERHFNKSAQITRDGVDGLIQAIKVWLKIS